jgi:hypothetical protein
MAPANAYRTADRRRTIVAYRLKGTFVGHCDCQQICPCAMDGPPTGRDGKCHGLEVFSIKEGNLDDIDLSGVNVAMGYMAPSNISSGNLRLGIVVDEAASDEQADALGRIFKGDEGGMFGEFVPLVGEWAGVERASVSFSDGDEPSAKIGDTDVNFEAHKGPDGNPTTVSNAAFGFAPTFTVGKSSGQSGILGEAFEANYGEAAEFEYTT